MHLPRKNNKEKYPTGCILFPFSFGISIGATAYNPRTCCPAVTACLFFLIPLLSSLIFLPILIFKPSSQTGLQFELTSTFPVLRPVTTLSYRPIDQSRPKNPGGDLQTHPSKKVPSVCPFSVGPRREEWVLTWRKSMAKI